MRPQPSKTLSYDADHLQGSRNSSGMDESFPDSQVGAMQAFIHWLRHSNANTIPIPNRNS